MSARETTFTVHNAKHVAKVWGNINPQKPGVIALHGWLDNAASFDVLAPELCKICPDLAIVALDSPGHGFSAHKPPQATYHFWDDILDVLQVADQLGWETFSLIGHSRGAIIGVMLAHAAPERLRDLVLLDAMFARPQEAAEVSRQLRDFVQQNRAVPNKRLPVYASIDDAIAARCRGTNLTMSPIAARPIVERGLKPVDGGFTWRTDPRLTTAAALKLTDAHNREMVSQLAVPTLLLLADEGIGGRIEMQQAMRELPLPAALQWQAVPGNHYFHIDANVTDIAQRIAKFWKS